jgi:predicted Zn-dependent protease
MLDVSLERTQDVELAAQAVQADRSGRKLLTENRASEAVDAFRKAHALERENAKYELDLIQALMAAGKIAEAQPLMTEILEEESNNGEANLIAARLAAKQGHINVADSYYHRSIYGEWPQNVVQHQIDVRLELIHFLLERGKQDEILAELLPLQEQTTHNTALQPRIAKLFLQAGSPSRAADVYRRLIKAQPANSANYAGLGDAELALGDFRAAHAAFASAVARDVRTPEWRQRLELSTALSDLDPTVRWLSSAEKYARSMRILQMATADLQQCITNHPQLATDEASGLVSTAEQQLAAKPPKQPTNEMAEDALSLAERIWHTRTSLCGTGTASDEEPLRLIMDKVLK